MEEVKSSTIDLPKLSAAIVECFVSFSRTDAHTCSCKLMFMLR